MFPSSTIFFLSFIEIISKSGRNRNNQGKVYKYQFFPSLFGISYEFFVELQIFSSSFLEFTMNFLEFHFFVEFHMTWINYYRWCLFGEIRENFAKARHPKMAMPSPCKLTKNATWQGTHIVKIRCDFDLERWSWSTTTFLFNWYKFGSS